MRWDLKNGLRSPRKTVRRFALWPTKVFDSSQNKYVMIWLEPYKSIRKFFDDDEGGFWLTIKRIK